MKRLPPQNWLYLILAGVISVLVLPVSTYAHPGGTDSSGCHTCRTNCPSWGLSYNEYHCHNAKALPQPEEPIRSHYGEGGTGTTEPWPAYQSSTQTSTKTVSKTITQSNIRSSLIRGMSGSEVTRLQQILSKDPAVYPEGLVTGYFGLATERAVMRYQKKHALEQVGVVGPKTRALLNSY